MYGDFMSPIRPIQDLFGLRHFESLLCVHVCYIWRELERHRSRLPYTHNTTPLAESPATPLQLTHGPIGNSQAAGLFKSVDCKSDDT